ncbi:hypothetical protein ACFE04_027570 [Oxalis oulophora]
MDGMKVISQLPEEPIHKILDLLNTKEASRTCVLSKTWNGCQETIIYPGLAYRVLAYAARRTVQNLVLENIRLEGLPQLKKVKVVCCPELRTTEIRAPNLEHVTVQHCLSLSIDIKASKLEQVSVEESNEIEIKIKASTGLENHVVHDSML